MSAQGDPAATQRGGTVEPNPSDPKPTGTGDPSPAAPNAGGQGDPAPTGNQNPNSDPATGDGQKDPAGLERSLAAARKDADERAKELRDSKKELAAAQAKLKEHEDAQKSEIDKANERATAAEERLQVAEKRARETALRFEVTRVAVAANFSDPEDAYRMIDWSAVEFDDDGRPQGVAPLVEQLAKDKAYLLKQAPPNPLRAPPATPNATGNGKQIPADEEKQRQAALNSQVRQMF